MIVFAFHALPAQAPASDPSLTQAMLAEIRQLRSHLQTTAATIQRVNIVMFRIQTQSGQDLAELRWDLTRLAVEVPRCQAEQAEAEIQLRTEQNRLSDLQDQLEKLDKALSAYAAK